MPYLGNTPTTQNFISGTDYFNGTGAQTAFTLTRTVNSVNDIQVVVNNVVQQPNDAYTLSGTTLTMTSAPSAGTNNVYVRYLSTTTQVITPSQNTVSWNTLDSNTQQDLGLMYKNKIINGNMVIDQRNAGASVTPTTGQYVIDRFGCFLSAASKFTAQQNAGSVTPPAGFRNYLGFTSSSAYTIGAAEIFGFAQTIEAFNIADLAWGTANAKTVTLSFWVRSSLTGQFGGFLKNGGLNVGGSFNNYFYTYGYTINSANTWEYKTIVIQAPTAGSWETTNGPGVSVCWSLGAGSTYTGGSASWSSTFYNQPAGSVNLVATNGATLYITGVQLEVGTQATAFSTAGGSYGAELALCQRYTYRHSAEGNVDNYAPLGQGRYYGTNAAQLYVPFKVTMRTSPSTVTQVGNIVVNDTAFSAFAITLALNETSSSGATVTGTTTSGTTAGNATTFYADNTSNAALIFSAEL